MTREYPGFNSVVNYYEDFNIKVQLMAANIIIHCETKLIFARFIGFINLYLN
jgi:hypothetical protein